MAKKMIIKGVGTFMAKRFKKDGHGVEVITLGSLQDLKIDMNVELEDIFGGDGLFAIDTLVKSKSIEITATDAKFDLDAVQLVMGSTVTENQSSYVWVLGEQAPIGDDGLGTPVNGMVTVEFNASIFGNGNVSTRLKDSNTLLDKVANKTAITSANEFAFDETTGELYFHDSLIGQDVIFNYQREETVDIVDILVDEVPFPVHVIHHGSFLQKDGTFQGVETELFSCRAKGSLSIDAQRANASANQVTLQVLDPERTDGKLGTIKRYSATKKV